MKSEQAEIASDNLIVIKRYLNEQLDRQRITQEEYDEELKEAIKAYEKELIKIFTQ